MINIFVTYRCNLACSYCFARELHSEYPEDLTGERFDRLLKWMCGASLPAAAFIGGEPTLHPRLPDMVRRTAECLDCKDFMRRCQGGCMALRRTARGQAVASSPSDAVEVDRT